MSAIAPLGGIEQLARPAASAVQQGANAAQGAATPEQSFSEVMTTYMIDARNSVTNAETVAMKGIMGEVSHREVAEAVLSAERSLKAAGAIRDKIVQAYLEISRMQI